MKSCFGWQASDAWLGVMGCGEHWGEARARELCRHLLAQGLHPHSLFNSVYGSININQNYFCHFFFLLFPPFCYFISLFFQLYFFPSLSFFFHSFFLSILFLCCSRPERRFCVCVHVFVRACLGVHVFCECVFCVPCCFIPFSQNLKR